MFIYIYIYIIVFILVSYALLFRYDYIMVRFLIREAFRGVVLIREGIY